MEVKMSKSLGELAKDHWPWVIAGGLVTATWLTGVHAIMNRPDNQPAQPVPAQPAQPVQPQKPNPGLVGKVRPAAKPVQPVQPAQPAKPAQPVQPVQPKPVQPAQPAAKGFYNRGIHPSDVEPEKLYVTGTDGLCYRPGHKFPDGVILDEVSRRGKTILREHYAKERAEKLGELVREAEKNKRLQAQAGLMQQRNAIYKQIEKLEAEKAKLTGGDGPDLGDVLGVINKKQAEAHGIPFKDMPGFKLAYIVKTPDAEKAKVGPVYAVIETSDGKTVEKALTADALKLLKEKLHYEL
jgi:hypothetical protein